MADDQATEPPALTLPAAMRAKYPPEQYAMFFDVPDNVGLKSHRRADAIACGCWGSTGHLIHGFEFKASRSDWLRELKAVDKADPFILRCDRWWLVTTSKEIAKVEEIPACWGWLNLTKTGLRVEKPAPALHDPHPATIPRLFMLAILRKLQDEMVDGAELRRRVEAANQAAEAKIAERVEARVKDFDRDAARLRDKVATFEKELGLPLTDWRAAHVAKIALELAKMNYSADSLDEIDEVLAGHEKTLGNLLECVKLGRAQCKATNEGARIDAIANRDN